MSLSQALNQNAQCYEATVALSKEGKEELVVAHTRRIGMANPF